MAKFTNVYFSFLSAGDDGGSSRGTVVTRPGEMVLDVELAGDRPYVIQGHERDGFFEGAHQGPLGDTPVTAKWTRLDDKWIGTWLEEGIDYLFTFELPKATSHKG